ncbi:MAG: hypothetical protein NTV99_10305 [Deltaproteobacteria bacterium]|nr:hypothetical protein [Deltaproteobacteria bacterium]
MKKVILILAMVVLGSLFFFNADAKAQTSPGWGGGDDDFYCPYCDRPGGTRGGYGMGPGYGGGYGMGPGMMQGSRGYRQPPSEACQKFLNETAGLRKELHMKRYEYNEAVNDPKAKPEALSKLEKEMLELRQKIRDKNPSVCWH